MSVRRAVPNRRPRPTPRAGCPKPPVPPETLVIAVLPDQEPEPEATFRALEFADLDLTGREAEAVEFSQCRLRAATLAGSRLAGLRLTDCLVLGSDWSNLDGDSGALERVKVTDSRMTGLVWSDGLVRDTAFRDSKLDLTNWRLAHFDRVTFTDCNLTGADFTEADLRGAAFVRCNLTGAQFSNADLHGTRFQRCELAGIGGVTSWAGAVVHRDDLLELSYALAGALGIVVEGDAP